MTLSEYADLISISSNTRLLQPIFSLQLNSTATSVADVPCNPWYKTSLTCTADVC